MKHFGLYSSYAIFKNFHLKQVVSKHGLLKVFRSFKDGLDVDVFDFQIEL
jgi:hypothetical protein